MKLRQGFVSNSSSSSFVVIGKKVKLQDVDLTTGETYIAIGDTMGEGVDVFNITEELLPWMMLVNYQFCVFEAAERVYNCGRITLDGGTYDVEVVEASYHGTDSIETLLDFYRIDKDSLVKLVQDGKMTIEEFAERLQR